MSTANSAKRQLAAAPPTQEQQKMSVKRAWSVKEYVLCASEVDGQRLELFKFPDWQDDYDAALAAVKQNGLALKHVSRSLRSDVCIFKQAILSHVCVYSSRLSSLTALPCNMMLRDSTKIRTLLSSQQAHRQVRP